MIVKTLYSKTELDKLRDDIKKQIVDPAIKKLEASLDSSVERTKDFVTSLKSSIADTVSSLNSAKETIRSIQSSMGLLERQVQWEPSRKTKMETILQI